MNVNQLLEIAKSELPNIKPNEKFTLKDLFKGYVWNRIDQGTRRKLGTSFLIYVETQPDIKVVNDTGSQRLYKKNL